MYMYSVHVYYLFVLIAMTFMYVALVRDACVRVRVCLCPSCARCRSGKETALDLDCMTLSLCYAMSSHASMMMGEVRKVNLW